MEAVIRTENLTHIYSPNTPYETVGLKNVNLEIYEGEFVGIMGHTGSGKSTLMQHLNGLLKPTEGCVLYKGRDIWEKGVNIRDIRFEIGLVFQYPEYQLFEETVFKDIAFGPRNMKLSEDEIKERVLEASSFVGITDEMLEKSPFELSGGQKRKVAMAGVMAMRPKVLVLDEPTAGLDPKSKEEMLLGIKKYHDMGNTVVWVTHSMEDIARFTDRIVVMYKSEIIMSGTPTEVFMRANELNKIGLSVPQITKILIELNKKGIEIDPSIYTLEGALEALIKWRAEHA